MSSPSLMQQLSQRSPWLLVTHYKQLFWATAAVNALLVGLLGVLLWANLLPESIWPYWVLYTQGGVLGQFYLLTLLLQHQQWPLMVGLSFLRMMGFALLICLLANSMPQVKQAWAVVVVFSACFSYKGVILAHALLVFAVSVFKKSSGTGRPL